MRTTLLAEQVEGSVGTAAVRLRLRCLTVPSAHHRQSPAFDTARCEGLLEPAGLDGVNPVGRAMGGRCKFCAKGCWSSLSLAEPMRSRVADRREEVR